jgi:predicted nucleotidyltransferase
MNAKAWAENHSIHRIVAGSHLYGTNRPDSDIDIRGVCLMPIEALLGLSPFEQYQVTNDQEDITIYGLSKFFALALDANPNILDILCAPPETWQLNTTLWNKIHQERHLFLSQKLRYTFSGYAISQLKRLERHHEWLVRPPDHQPEPEEFGCWVETDDKGGQTLRGEAPLDTQHYQQAMQRWQQYQTWLKERNPARAALEAAYGYDTKHACHLVRLMLKVAGVLTTGDYSPRLEGDDLNIVLSVLHGEWSYERLVSWAQLSDITVREMPSILPYSPNRKAAEQLLVQANSWTLNTYGGMR